MLAIAGPAASGAAEPEITVAVASSWLAHAQVVAGAFERAHRLRVRLVPGSSGRLFHQIAHGAPFDVFISADARLAARAAGGRETRRVGRGWLGVRIGSRLVEDPAALLAPGIRRVALADPEVAPFGRAARQALEARGLWRRLSPKLVRAQSALGAKMLVDRGLVAAGLVPVGPDAPHLAALEYRAALLSDRPQARAFFSALAETAK